MANPKPSAVARRQPRRSKIERTLSHSPLNPAFCYDPLRSIIRVAITIPVPVTACPSYCRPADTSLAEDGLLNEIYNLAVATIMAALFSFSPVWGHRLIYRGIWPTKVSTTSGNPKSRFGRASFGMANFGMADVGCLFVYVAAFCGLARLVNNGPNQRTDFWGFYLLIAGCLLAVLVWMIALRFVAERGIGKLRSKVLFLLVLYPLSIIVSTHALMFLVMVVLILWNGRGNPFSFLNATQVWLAVMGLAYLIFATWLMRAAFDRYLFESWLPSDDPFANESDV